MTFNPVDILNTGVSGFDLERARKGSGCAKCLKPLRTNVKTPLFRACIELFRGKKSIIHNHQ
jgi:hypothetical protein